MGEETEEEPYDDEGMDADVSDDLDDDELEIDDDDIDLGEIDGDVTDFDDDAGDERPARSSGSSKDDDLLKSNYEQAIKANPKRAQKHQKRKREIEGVLDTAKLGTEEGASKAWDALQKGAGKVKPRKFKVSENYTENDVIDHPKFGVGYVVEILTSTKMSVLFEDGIKKLAHNKA